MERIGLATEDGLSGLLREVNVRSAVYCLSDFSAPWGFQVENSPVAKFHVLLSGTAWLSAGDQAAVELSSGDLVLLPNGDAHAIADRTGSPVRQLDAILAEHPVDAAGRLAYGGDGAAARLLCGGFELGQALPDEFADILPPVLVLDAQTGLARWLEPLFALFKEEAQASAPGASAIFAKLADVFLTQALRSYLAAANAGAGFRHPVRSDPEITRVLKLARAHLEARWTVGSLASAAGMSRTSFNSRFRAVVGEPPMSYLTRQRLSRAAGYLSTTSNSVRQIAHLVGYDNEASFTKAFRRAFGCPPGQYRREQATIGVPTASRQNY
jgi:AraC-like DNA-binding protein